MNFSSKISKSCALIAPIFGHKIADWLIGHAFMALQYQNPEKQG
jgi:hypothetical protein